MKEDMNKDRKITQNQTITKSKKKIRRKSHIEKYNLKIH